MSLAVNAFSSGMASRSSMRMSSANELRLPLCGVALAKISASVRRASRRASRLRRDASPIRLCDSSMTTASQVVASRW